MKNLTIVITIFIATLVVLNSNTGNSTLLPKNSDATVDQEQFFEIGSLFDANTTFAQMAEPGVYTIIEVYSENCGRCKVLEADFPKLLRQRNDIVIKRVKTFSGSISFRTKSEADVWFNRQDAIMDFYKVKGTPHVEIYDGSTPLALDHENKKTGTALLSGILKDLS